MAEKPLVYLILGAAGSGRRQVLTDLLGDGLVATDRPAVMLAASELADEADATLPALTRWSWTDGMITGMLPREATHVFFVSEGRENPVEQIEVFVAWLEAQGGLPAMAERNRAKAQVLYDFLDQSQLFRGTARADSTATWRLWTIRSATKARTAGSSRTIPTTAPISKFCWPTTCL